MNEEDLPFMNYRVWKCLACKGVMELQVYENHSIPNRCHHCGTIDVDAFQAFITSGKKGCLLIWDEAAL